MKARLRRQFHESEIKSKIQSKFKLQSNVNAEYEGNYCELKQVRFVVNPAETKIESDRAL